MLILGVDPGYAISGYGLVESKAGRLKLLDSGVITTPSTEAFPQRLEKIYQGLNELIAFHRPHAMAVEELFLGRNKTTVIGTAQARGVALLAAAGFSLPVFEFTPMQIKKAVTGNGRAEKQQVQSMVQVLLAMDELPKPDDLADALAVAICQCFMGVQAEFIAQSGYQRQAQRKRYGTRVNIGKLADQLPKNE